jgi:hypothetical protein
MPAGRRGHKIREYKRRIDAVLEDERGRKAPPPPPISEEHAALRRRIAEDCAEIELDPSPAISGVALCAHPRAQRLLSGR